MTPAPAVLGVYRPTLREVEIAKLVATYDRPIFVTSDQDVSVLRRERSIVH